MYAEHPDHFGSSQGSVSKQQTRPEGCHKEHFLKSSVINSLSLSSVTNVFTRKRLYSLQTFFYTEEPFLKSAFTQNFYTKEFLHGEFFAQKNFYTKNFAHKTFHTKQFLHTNAFTHRNLYPQKPLHKKKYTEKLYTQRLLHKNVLTHR